MAHHAYLIEGDREEGLARMHAFRDEGSSELQVFTFEQLTIEHARKLRELMYQSGATGGRTIGIYTARIFHEAQNALLKVFEEPPQGTILILGVPSAGMLLPTLRSRVVPLPAPLGAGDAVSARRQAQHAGTAMDEVDPFLLPKTEREKYFAKLVERAKADSESAKHVARAEASRIVSRAIERAHAAVARETEPRARQELLAFLADAAAFLPLTHERSAPLKLVFEHLQLVIPKALQETPV